MAPHNCSTDGCRGLKFDGANVKCGRCLGVTFIECIAGKTEVNELIIAISKVTTSTPVGNTNRMHIKIKKIFDDSSLFGYTCAKCKSAGTFSEILEREKMAIKTDYDTKMMFQQRRENDIATELQTQRSAVTSLQAELNRIQQEKLNSSHLNQRVTDHNANLLTENNILGQQVNELNARVAELTNQLSQRHNGSDVDMHDASEIKDYIRHEMYNMRQEIEARIKLECTEVMKEVAKISSVDNNSAKRKKTLNTEQNDDVFSQNGAASNINAVNTSNLKPPTEDNTDSNKNDKKSVYELHV